MNVIKRIAIATDATLRRVVGAVLAAMGETEASRLVNPKRDVLKLYDCALLGDYERVEKLLNLGADPNERDPEGWTPLMCATMYGRADIVLLLIERGADVMARDPDGETALDIAKRGQYVGIINMLEHFQRAE